MSAIKYVLFGSLPSDVICQWEVLKVKPDIELETLKENSKKSLESRLTLEGTDFLVDRAFLIKKPLDYERQTALAFWFKTKVVSVLTAVIAEALIFYSGYRLYSRAPSLLMRAAILMATVWLTQTNFMHCISKFKRALQESSLWNLCPGSLFLDERNKVSLTGELFTVETLKNLKYLHPKEKVVKFNNYLMRYFQDKSVGLTKIGQEFAWMKSFFHAKELNPFDSRVVMAFGGDFIEQLKSRVYEFESLKWLSGLAEKVDQENSLIFKEIERVIQNRPGEERFKSRALVALKLYEDEISQERKILELTKAFFENAYSSLKNPVHTCLETPVKNFLPIGVMGMSAEELEKDLIKNCPGSESETYARFIRDLKLAELFKRSIL